MNPTRLKQIEQALKKRPMTRKELAATVFLSERAVENNMKRMHERGQVHVAGWSRTKGTIARVYAWGIGTDAPRPSAYSVYERVQRVRERESQEDKDFRLARERGKRRKIKVDPLMAAFYSLPK
jgi:predicted ArsR family transcriptional regulator